MPVALPCLSQPPLRNKIRHLQSKKNYHNYRYDPLGGFKNVCFMQIQCSLQLYVPPPAQASYIYVEIVFFVCCCLVDSVLMQVQSALCPKNKNIYREFPLSTVPGLVRFSNSTKQYIFPGLVRFFSNFVGMFLFFSTFHNWSIGDLEKSQNVQP